jgi:hypothetical protein
MELDLPLIFTVLMGLAILAVRGVRVFSEMQTPWWKATKGTRIPLVSLSTCGQGSPGSPW